MKTEKLWNKKDIERIIDEHIDHLKKEGRVKTEEFEGVPRQPFTDKKITKHFTKQKFNLSEKIYISDGDEVIHIVDAKEAVRRLKEALCGSSKSISSLMISGEIDNIFGDELTK